MFFPLLCALRLKFARMKWRRLNKNNTTQMGNYFEAKQVKIGNFTYGTLNIYHLVHSRVEIGHLCSIADGVSFICAGHRADTFSTFPIKSLLFGNIEAYSKGDITVGSDVWLGFRCIILSGVTIGQGAIVAAGAIVTKDVPPYAIVAGAPAKIIRSRFPEQTIAKLLKIDFSRFSKKYMTANLSILYDTEIDRVAESLLDIKD